jgi:hypothetical protein
LEWYGVVITRARPEHGDHHCDVELKSATVEEKVIARTEKKATKNECTSSILLKLKIQIYLHIRIYYSNLNYLYNNF